MKKNKKSKRILVDMSCSFIHHGHIKLLKKAKKLGKWTWSSSGLESGNFAYFSENTRFSGVTKKYGKIYNF